MAKRLTAGVLNGTAYRELFNFEWQGEEYEVEIRPLNNEEALKVEECMQEGVTVDVKEGPQKKLLKRVHFDSKENFRGRRKADILAVALGTVDPSITVDVVDREIPPKVVREIAQRILQISGIGNDEEIQDFAEGGTFPRDKESDN